MVTLKDIPKTVAEAFAQDQIRFAEVREAVEKKAAERMRILQNLAPSEGDLKKRREIELLSLPGIALNDICGAASLIREFYGVQPIPRATSIEDEMLLFFDVPATRDEHADFNDRLGDLLRLLHEQFPAIMEHVAVGIKSKR